MKNLIFTISAILIFSTLFAQDLIYKKDGSEIKAKVTEITMDDIKYKKFDFQDGPLYIIKIEDVFMVIYENGQKEVFKKGTMEEKYKENNNVKTSDYGGNLSLGICIGGGGIVGVPVRFFPTEKVALEAGLFLRPVLVLESGNLDFEGVNIAIVGGPVIYFNKKFNDRKHRVQLSGMFLKGGFSSGSRINETIFAIGWAYERFKINKKNKSVSFELGLGISRLKDKDFVPKDTWYYSEDESLAYSIMPMIYWKVGWNFFPSTKK